MESSITFLCQHCMMSTDDRGPLNREPNSISEIAFSMPERIFDDIREKVADADPDLARRIAEDDRFKCITMEDVANHVEVDKVNDKVDDDDGRHRIGWLVLTRRWLRERLVKLGIDFDPTVVSGEGALYSGRLAFCFNKASDGSLIPDEIRTARMKDLCKELRCSRCGRLLPADTGKAPELRILLQGNSRAGKTSLIVATFQWILTMAHNEESGITYVLSEDRDGYDRGVKLDLNAYHRWIKQELENYNNGQKVEKTPVTQKEPGSVSTLVHFGDQPLVLTFLDMPGEFFESNQDGEQLLLSQYFYIYKKVDVIWTCLQYEVMVDKDWSGEAEEIVNATGVKPVDLALDRANYMSRIRELKKNLTGIKDKPHAVILTKTDSLLGRVDGLEEYKIFSGDRKHEWDNLTDGFASYPCGGNRRNPLLLENEFHGIASNVYKFCKKSVDEGRTDMLRELVSLTDQVAFFANSAYGRPALDNQGSQEREPRPYHVQLPLLWSLAVCEKLRIHYEINVRTGFLGRGSRKETKEVFLKQADEQCREHLLKNVDYYTPHERRQRGGN